ncbi:uncharacterized protein LOC142976808 [Anticarsia gemmatalis]|uniref:uncharacterized protein LOC142976808 n=1 Tax=Anticarsia gemmatalis TaxID=129554 RepID=UPI003F76BF3F
MALKVLPNDVRSMLCASSQINNYKTAVEELVYNSLDAESTSIAIRVHMQESRIQVIDNGCGISENDFHALGQRHMTSKLIDLSSLKAMPKYYGFKGEFLANIINISHDVKITSRHMKVEETWAKTFYKGKEKKLTKITTRPSKGTTVDIKGFLFNLNIQKRTIDPVNELQNMKSFLEQLSVVHNNISLSLRDDSKNEIIFKIHKKRDVYQTLSTLFDIESTAVQELQVEKNQYKVKAFMGKPDMDIGRHWIYVNGKFIHNTSKLYKIINEHFKKCLLLRDKKKSKSKINHDEDHLFQQNIPFYFVFLTCPYIDYDTSTTSKQLNVEFKNWEQINKMLEKLVKFYVGDFNVKQVNNNENQVIVNQPEYENDDNNQDKIKKIIDKILGSDSKKLRVSQLQNGVKGKMIKRRNKKKKLNSVHLNSKIGDLVNNKNKKNIALDKPIQDNIENENFTNTSPMEIEVHPGNSNNTAKVSHTDNNEMIPNSTPTAIPNKKCEDECVNSDEQFLSNPIVYSILENDTVNNETCNQGDKDVNVVFVSNTQHSDINSLNDVDPINLCETVFHNNGTIEKEFAASFGNNNRLDDSLYNNFGNIIRDKYLTQVIQTHNQDEDVSHHFGNTLTAKHLNAIDDIEAKFQEAIVEMDKNQENHTDHFVKQNELNYDTYFNGTDINFNVKERLRFLPKGMSQIFEKCGSKTVCDYNLDTDYYEDVIYNDFASDVHMQAEVYQPLIQNVEDLTTKDIHKFKNKVHKENASLAFDETSLKEAQVLNQVDCKFIAVVMKEKYRESEIASEYLVLFDQHAVHERIRLENNLEGYLKDDKWTSVPLENVTIKMSKDEIVYLHNYKDKFNQLGLEWTILNKDEVSINCIPEAILGKNPREVDKVMKAVKNLITEEINNIKMQKGCISLYPKAIMDLVFSEACRYAIKFGDKLSKNDCIQLLSDLSHCKTPFQCAHGRPVMAVLIEVKSNTCEFKFDTASLIRFKHKRNIINMDK